MLHRRIFNAKFFSNSSSIVCVDFAESGSFCFTRAPTADDNFLVKMASMNHTNFVFSVSSADKNLQAPTVCPAIVRLTICHLSRKTTAKKQKSFALSRIIFELKDKQLKVCNWIHRLWQILTSACDPDELTVHQGQLRVMPAVVAAQEAWIFTGTIQQNILFGSQMHSARYEQVIRFVR